ncbi:YdcF family protein [Ferrovibrio sp.]|uniref:YdcF family protein n=1 Tax=Ferrovibrio sp. TaxID=1917215 RepID=UPI0025C1C9DE|nr:YdcF family protein [Ferrovibrio sp.]MBX3456050.1 YdcF family protein [Ferrovibrio sp.]
MIRHAALLVLAIGLLLLGGLLTFLRQVDLPPVSVIEQHNDGIVVLTGGTARLASAVRLLQENFADRLFISGAGQGVSKASLIQALATTQGHNISEIELAALMECCIDIGFEAADTAGNAVESAAWAGSHGYSALLLVTANYHMPRALVEFRRRMPGMQITPHPVQPDFLRVQDWWRQRSAGLFLVGEYLKYVAALLRARIEDGVDALLGAGEAG